MWCLPLALLLCLLASAGSWAQARLVTGRVVSAADTTALPGVTVVAKGTTVGTATDANGQFSLNVPAQSNVLVFSYIGFATREVAVGNNSSLTVRLQTDVKTLGEVVVTALGTVVQNAGKIRNQGVEVMLSLTPIRAANDVFRWDINVNFSRNRSRVLELAEGITRYQLASRYFSVEARVGERMGDLYGLGYARVQSANPDAPHYDPTGQYAGQMVVSGQGRPVPTAAPVNLGNYNPGWLGGIYNTFTYKGFSLGFLFDVRYGGKVYSHTYTVGREGGQLEETLQGRENGYYDTSNDPRFLDAPEGTYYVVPGVVQNDDGSFAPNERRIAAREWHTAFTLGRSVLEGAVFDATFTKLREVKFGYTLLNRLLGRAPLRNVNLSLVGRNLFLWTKVPHIDPETSSVSGGTVIPGAESVAIPSTHSMGVNLSFRF